MSTIEAVNSRDNMIEPSSSPDLEKGHPKQTFLSTLKRKWKLILTTLLAIILIFAISLGVGLGVGLRNKNADDNAADSPSSLQSSTSSSSSSPHNSTNNATTTSTQFNTSDPNLWRPAPSTRWQIELKGPITNTSLPDVPLYDIDLFENNASTIKSLHSAQKKVICYFSAGSLEDWRPDAGKFNRSAGGGDVGKPLQGWKGEYWLNTRSASVRAIMTARLDMAREKGCDGVDPDNIDAYDNDNGLSLSEDDAVDYLSFLANEAHARNISIGLKNGGDVVSRVVAGMEWVVVEQCVQYKQCGLYVPFVEGGKAVLSIEYPSKGQDIAASDVASKCPTKKGFSGVLKKMGLDDWVVECPAL